MLSEEFPVPVDQVRGLRETIGDTPEGLEDFEMIEDLVSSIVCTGIEKKRLWAQEMLKRFLGRPVNVRTLTDGEEIYAYITVDDECFLYIGTYPTGHPAIETALTQRQLNLYDPNA